MVLKCSLFRERYVSAKKQLEKGRNMFENTIKRLANIPDWRHVGFVCFTEIENRQVVRNHLPDLNDEDIQVRENQTTLYGNEFNESLIVHSDKERD